MILTTEHLNKMIEERRHNLIEGAHESVTPHTAGRYEGMHDQLGEAAPLIFAAYDAIIALKQLDPVARKPLIDSLEAAILRLL